MLDFLIQWVGNLLQPLLAPIMVGVGVVVAGILAYFKGKSDQAQKGKIAAQKETIDAHKDRDEVEDAIRGATADERKRLRDKWTRDN